MRGDDDDDGESPMVANLSDSPLLPPASIDGACTREPSRISEPARERLRTSFRELLSIAASIIVPDSLGPHMSDDNKGRVATHEKRPSKSVSNRPKALRF